MRVDSFNRNAEKPSPAARQQYNHARVASTSVAPLPSLTFGSRRPILGQGEVRIRLTAHPASRFVEDPDQLRRVRDQVMAIRTFDALNFIFLDVNQHRLCAAFWATQNIFRSFFLRHSHTMIEYPSPFPGQSH
jgi:hypothetical protein